MEPCVVLHDVPSSMPGMLSLKAGTTVLAKPSENPEWWEAICDNRVGFVPASYLRLAAVATDNASWGKVRDASHAARDAAHAAALEADANELDARRKREADVAQKLARVQARTAPQPQTPYRAHVVGSLLTPRIAGAALVPRAESSATSPPWYMRSARRGEHIRKAETHITGRERRIQHLMCVKVQAQYRRLATVRRLQRYFAATRLSSVRRGIVARRRCAIMATERLHGWAARTLQRFWHDRDVFHDRCMLRRRAAKGHARAVFHWDEDGSPAHSHRPLALRVKPAYPPLPMVRTMDGLLHDLGPWRRF